jgi:hypothetical protein
MYFSAPLAARRSPLAARRSPLGGEVHVILHCTGSSVE